jgi:hypothetical protein
MSGFWGKFDGVCFLDAGCEVNFNFLSQRRLKRILIQAEHGGVVAYTIDSSEQKMTKRALLNYFDLDSDTSNQFQSGSVFFFGEKGREIASEWAQVTSADVHFSDDSVSIGGELDGFYEHRHDQSILSLILKKHGVASAFPHPPGNPPCWRVSVQNIVSPIWWSRNRTGISDRRAIDLFLTILTRYFRSLVSHVKLFSLLASGNFIYLRVGGGLGNQLHQYLAGRAVSQISGRTLLIDVEGIGSSDHGPKSSLTDFNLDGMVLNKKFVSWVFSLVRRASGRLRRFYAFPSIYIAKDAGYCEDLISRAPQIRYLEGFFHTYKYSDLRSSHASEFQLTLKNQSSNWLQEIYADLKNLNICAVHIRHGDYIKTWSHYGVLSSDYYEDALSNLESSKIDEIWIFTDSSNLILDEWEFLKPFKVRIINPPDTSTASESLAAMSRAQWIITANSTFSWWGGFMSSPSRKTVLYPTPFFRKGAEIREFVPSDWLAIQSRWIDF